VILGFPVTTAARFFTAMVNLVDSRPGSALCFILRKPTLFVAFLDVLCLAFLLVGVP
jgi:hypothetical protein